MKLYLSILFCLLGLCCHAQKETSFSIDAEEVKRIVLDSDEIFKITIVAAPVETISYSTHSEGEYSNRIRLDHEIKEGTLYLRSRFPEILSSGYDKLSAHKVFSMEVEITVPENLSMDIASNRASVYASGTFKELVVQLKTGSAFLNNFEGDAIVNTYNGNIEVETLDAEIRADSHHGKVELPAKLSGSHKISLSSINGHIKVLNTK